MKPIPKFVAVLHCTKDQIHNAEQVAMALKHGAGGVMFIQHDGTARGDRVALEALVAARETYPNAWLGINLLSITDPDKLAHALSFGDYKVDAVWTDASATNAEAATKLFNVAHCPLLAGFAFKYQPQPDDASFDDSALAASYNCFGLVTSGEATGHAADAERVARIRKAMHPDTRLILASGVTPENYHHYKDHVSSVFVGTGISSSFTEFDPVKIEAMAMVVRGGLPISDKALHAPKLPEKPTMEEIAEWLEALAQWERQQPAGRQMDAREWAATCLSTSAEELKTKVFWPEVNEMALCEASRLFLRPGQLYRFTAIKGCPQCAAQAIPYSDRTSSGSNGASSMSMHDPDIDTCISPNGSESDLREVYEGYTADESGDPELFAVMVDGMEKVRADMAAQLDTRGWRQVLLTFNPELPHVEYLIVGTKGEEEREAAIEAAHLALSPAWESDEDDEDVCATCHELSSNCSCPPGTEPPYP